MFKITNMAEDEVLLKIYRTFRKEEGIRFMYDKINNDQKKLDRLIKENKELGEKIKNLVKDNSSLRFKFTLLKRYFKVNFTKDNKLIWKKDFQMNEEIESEITELMM